MDETRREASKISLRSFGIELAVYSVFVFLYFLLVLHFLGGWLKELFDGHRASYAAAGLVVVLVQAAALEILTSSLLKFIRSKTDPSK